MSKELYGSKDKCLICDSLENPYGQGGLIILENYKYIMYVHKSCAFEAVMEDLRLQNLKHAWDNVFND